MNAPRLPAATDVEAWASRGINIVAARQKSLFIGTPVGDRTHMQYTASLAVTTSLLRTLGIPHAIEFMQGMPVADARNVLSAQFVAGEMSDLLFIDADESWAPLDVLRLLGHGLPLVGAVGRKKIPGSDGDIANWCFDHLDPPARPYDDGIVEVAAIGTGFMLVNRCVFTMLRDAHPEWERDGLRRNDPPYTEFFHTDLNETGRRRLSEDWSFCHRWRAIDGRVYADMTIAFAHHGSAEYGGLVSPAEALKGL